MAQISNEAFELTRRILSRLEKRYSAMVRLSLIFSRFLCTLSFGLIHYNPEPSPFEKEKIYLFKRLQEELDLTNQKSVDFALKAIAEEFPNLYSPLWQLDGSFYYPPGSLYGDVRELEKLLSVKPEKLAEAK